MRLPGREGERSSILRYFLTVGSDTPVFLEMLAIDSPRLLLLRISSILSTPIISPLALLTSQTEATTCWANRGMVGVPMLKHEKTLCSNPKLFVLNCRLLLD